MRSSRLLKLFCIVVFCLFGSCFARETKTYTCGPNFHPSDVTFGEDGWMYSVSPSFDNAIFSEKTIDEDVYRLGNSFQNLSGAIFLHNSFENLFATQKCISIETPFDRVFGIVAMSDGKLCTNTFTAILSAAQAEESALISTAACWNGWGWSQARFLDAPRGRHRDRRSNDLLIVKDKLWYTSWSESPNRQGRLTPIPLAELKPLDFYRFYQDTTITDAFADIVELGSLVIPHFLAASKGGNLFATTFSVEAGVKGRVRSWTVQLEETKIQTVYSRNSLLSGIVALENTLLVADYYAGELLELSMQGEVVHTFRGLEGPMGMERAPNGDICVAEMLGGRIRCFPLNTLRGYQPQTTLSRPESP